MSLNQDVDHVSILIDGPPEVVPLALDIHEELVQVPNVSQLPLSAPEPPGVAWAELPTPLPDGLVGDDDSSLRQELLNVSEAQAEAVVQPDGVTDDLRRKSVSAVAASIGIHQPKSAGTWIKSTIPS
jgi:hypothetical protein